MSGQPLDLGERLHRRPHAREPLARQPLDRDRLHERLETEAADRARPAARRKNVIRTCAEIAARHGGPFAHEDCTGVVHARRERLRVAEQDEMLRCDRLGLLQRLDDRAHGFMSVLGLRCQLELRQPSVASLAEHDDDLRRSGGEVDRDIARDGELCIVHVRAARADDLIDLLHVRQPCDRLWASDRPHLLDPEQLRRLRDEGGSVGRRAHDEPPNARRLRRDRAHHERRDEPARDVDADRVERHPAALELDARLDLEPHVCRPLSLMPAADTIGEHEHGVLRQLARRLRAGGLHAVEPQRPFAHRLLPTLLHVFDDVHPSIRSTGTRRIEEAPAASSSGSSRHTSAAGTRLWTATIPGSDSGSTLGAREPGTSAQIAPSASSGAFSIRYRVARASTTLRKTLASWTASPRGSGGPISTASDWSRTPTERRPFVRRVLPLETRSTIASASPSRGASSTEPCTSTSSIGTGMRSRASLGKLVAMRAPPSPSGAATPDSSGTATSSVHAPKPSRCSSLTRAPRSRTMSSPVMPQSTTPSCTYSGMSSARTSSASTGAFRHGNASARSPGVSGPSPASSRSAIAGSRSRPFDGTAILSVAAAGAEARAGSRPRPDAATAPRASPSSSNRAPASRPPGMAGRRRGASPPASGAPSRRAPSACTDRGGSAAPRPSSAATRSSRRDLGVPSSANVGAPLLPSC